MKKSIDNSIKNFSKFNSENDSVGFLMWQISTLWRRKIKQELMPLNITHAQYVVMAVTDMLNEKQTEVTQQDISQTSMIDVMTVSTILSLLEKKEYINRSRSQLDSRAKAIYVTKAGKNILQQATNTIENIDETFFCIDQNTKKDLLKILQILSKKISFDYT